jgi:nucleotide-binding universal stress UspA family protein
MLHIKKILCPVDFLPISERAVQYAAGLALDYDADIHLLHVVTPILPLAEGVPVATVAVIKTVEDASAARMKKLVSKLEKRGIMTKGEVRTGDVHDLIERTISKVKPDLIVMGSHARSGLERFFMGSVAEWLMRHSPVPILVISEKQKIPAEKTRRTKRAA